MKFNSLEFLVFLVIVWALYWLMGNRRRLQNAFLVAASYVFYGWWDWRFLGLILFTSLCSFASGLLVERNLSRPKRCKLFLWGNVTVNLLILGVFKYYNFFMESFSALMGIEAKGLLTGVILPVGISFYTFQALSYGIDVYRRKIPATRDVVAFLGYVSFFPQLVAGPIEMAQNLLCQFERDRVFCREEAVDGLRQMLWGFFKKMAVADNCARFVNMVFGGMGNFSGWVLAEGAVLFSIQIYCDFSGYSDIAIGCAKLFGFRLKRNFNVPYLSRDMGEFWRRWHISLNRWFTEYIYIPLGGSREGKWKMVRNTMVVFLVSGLWHGANWTFVAWGMYHALLFVPLIVLGRNRRHLDVVAEGRWLPNGKELLEMGSTFVLATVGWIVFRAECLRDAFDYLGGMLTMQEGNPLTFHYWWLIGLVALVEWVNRGRCHPLEISGWKWRWLRWSCYVVLVMCIVFFSPESEEFIYFQF